ncbi:MAG TPA: ABC transporter ATP-binding protein [Gemmatimonas sp.]|uniref:peptidase domain-containing ABC transporter n=1 Tax=Gemmatimonas sp. TaxID=1962908 RepID=UPI002EDAFF68
MSAQATRINQLIADALDLDVDQAHWRALTRQVPPDDPLAARIRSIGGAIDVGYLDRDLAAEQVQEAILDPQGPLVLLCVGGEDAIVVRRQHSGGASAVRVMRNGTDRSIDASPKELAQAVLRESGHRGRVPTMAPMALRSAGSARGDHAPHSPMHTHEEEELQHLNPVDRTIALLSRERREILTVFFYATLAGGLSLILPLAVGGIVQLVQGRLFLQPVIVLIALVIFGTIVAGVLQIGILRVGERIQQRVFARMAMEFAFRIPRMKYGASLETNLPEKMNRLFEAVAIQKALQKLLIDVPTALLTVAFSLILLTFYSPWFSVFAIVVVFILYLIIRWTGPEGMSTSIDESKYKYKAVHLLQEIARAMHAFKYAGDSTLPVEKMDGVVTSYIHYRKRHFAVLVKQTVALIGFKTFITAAVLILGAALVQSNQMLLGQFVAAEVVIVTVLVGVEKLITSLATVYDMLTSVDKAGHVSDLPLEPRGGLAATHDPSKGIAIEAREVRYRYPGASHASVAGVSVRIEPGQRVCIMGVDGSGRSTLLKLLGGLMEDYDGTLRFDGVTLRDLDRPALRTRIGQMLSWSDLFDGSVEENVSVGRAHITPRDVQQALDDLDINDAVQLLPQGIRTEITNGGRNLPAHLANKLLIAQGIVGNPRLVVLDDFFQNLDASSRTHIIRLLTDRSRPWTVVAVSHDPQLLSAFDRVLIVENGRIVCEGSFNDLRNDAVCKNLLHEFANDFTAEGA